MHQPVDVVPDELTIIDEAYEFEIPCEIPSLDAGWNCGARPAEWIAYRSIVCSCGVIVRLCCNVCRVKYQEMMAAHAYISCARCNDETHGFDRFEPLKVQS